MKGFGFKKSACATCVEQFSVCQNFSMDNVCLIADTVIAVSVFIIRRLLTE